jgi:hypothetical protein
MWALLLLACRPQASDVRVAQPSGLVPELPQTSGPGTTPGGTTPPGGTTTPGGTTEPPPALEGFVGSPCLDDLDCDYEGGVCLKEAEGFPLGMCSAACDQFCPDATGYPTTFCAEIDALPPDVGWLGDGGCLQRCDFGAYPYTGCRQDYGCVQVGRANEPGTETYVCMPDEAPALSPCLADLAGRGVPFSPTIIADSSPSTHPQLTCHVEEPITFQSGYLGVDLTYYDGAGPETVSGACELGHALADTIEDVADDGVTVIRHLGTTVCRVISGTDTLSRHAYGDAIDIYGFDFADGTHHTLIDDWEHETTSFATAQGQWLYETSHGWYDQQIWNIILTPNYNAAHDNHFHVDLTPGSDFIGMMGPGYIGPGWYVD